MTDGPKRFIWTDKSKKDFFNQLSNPDTIHQIDNVTNLYTHDPNKMVSGLTEILTKTAKKKE